MLRVQQRVAIEGSVRRVVVAAFVLLVGMLPRSVSAQDEPDGVLVVLQADATLSNLVESVAVRLRDELPSAIVRDASEAAADVGAARVTIEAGPDGALHIVYRDPSGRQAARVVVGRGDAAEIAASVAMVVSNLCRSQVDLALAAISLEPARAVTPLLATADVPGPPPEVVSVAPEPAAPRPVPPRRDPTRGRSARPATPVAHPHATRPASPGVWGVSLVSTLDWANGASLGAGVVLGRALGSFRAELYLYHRPSMDHWTRLDGQIVSGAYGHTAGELRLRKVLHAGRWVDLGAAVGLGGVLSVQEDVFVDEWSLDVPAAARGGRSDLDLLASIGGSLDVRLAGQTLFWATTADLLVTTGQKSQSRPFGPGTFWQLTTGLRLAL